MDTEIQTVLKAIRSIEGSTTSTLSTLQADVSEIKESLTGNMRDGTPGLIARMRQAETEIQALIGRQVWAERMTWGAITTAALTVIAALLLRGLGAG